MATMSTSTRSIISRSFTTKVHFLNHTRLYIYAPTYLDADTREEDLNHPEDIAHFAKHDREEEAAEHLQELEKRQVVEENIPQKFRRNP